MNRDNNGQGFEMERRFYEHPVEVRAVDGGAVIEGYAALFNVLSDDLGGFREMILPGAFAERLNDDVRALWQHDPLYVFGRTASGTLTLEEDAVGLRYRVRTPDAQWARDAQASIRRGDVSQSSFAFRMLDGDRWEIGEDGQVTRTIHRVAKLYDVSPVTYPAYPQTSADVAKRAAELRARLPHPSPLPGGEGTGNGDGAEAEDLRARELLRLRVRVRESVR
jgi:HK97 family phage prohead protease